MTQSGKSEPPTRSAEWTHGHLSLRKPEYVRVEVYTEALGEIIRREASLLGREIAAEMARERCWCGWRHLPGQPYRCPPAHTPEP